MVMLIVQYNYRREYKSIVIVLETALDIWAEIILLQEPFISNWKLVHSTFDIYWPKGDKIAICVMTVVRKNLLNKIVVEYKTNLVNHLYFIFPEI